MAGHLDATGFPAEHRRFAVSVHESADVAAAACWWADVVGVDVAVFDAPQLKRHNPTTVRKNVEKAYVGCLIVRLVQCRTLYQQIDGLWQGIMEALPQGSEDDLSRVVQGQDKGL